VKRCFLQVAIKILDKEKIQKQNMGGQIKKEVSVMLNCRRQDLQIGASRGSGQQTFSAACAHIVLADVSPSRSADLHHESSQARARGEAVRGVGEPNQGA
jgi:hypothetical protein